MRVSSLESSHQLKSGSFHCTVCDRSLEYPDLAWRTIRCGKMSNGLAAIPLIILFYSCPPAEANVGTVVENDSAILLKRQQFCKNLPTTINTERLYCWTSPEKRPSTLLLLRNNGLIAGCAPHFCHHHQGARTKAAALLRILKAQEEEEEADALSFQSVINPPPSQPPPPRALFKSGDCVPSRCTHTQSLGPPAAIYHDIRCGGGGGARLRRRRTFSPR